MKDFFKNKTFVFTGELTLDREYAKSKVILLGGRVTIAPSKKTDFLVVGAEPGPVKLKKAQDLNIKIIYEQEFTTNLNECLQSDDISNVLNQNNGGMTTEADQISSDFDEASVFDTPEESIQKSKDINAIIEPEKATTYTNMWSEKYRPKKRSDLIGNSSVIDSLADFMLGKTKNRGALLSGSPGIGKTTSVHVLCKELGLDLVEFNASDVRNKSLLVKKVKGIINSQGISKGLKLKKKIVLMDEVDGMTSDRGGLVELNNLIKESIIPIVCICNDRNNIKIRTLANNCLDLKFRKPDSRQIVPRIKVILKHENKVLGDNIINEVISLSHGDIRYILNNIQRICVNDKININLMSSLTKKTILKSVFEIASECFHSKSINEKTDLYFEDYSLIPLFIAENYMKLKFANLIDFYKSSESISSGDVVEKLIRGSTQEWSLLPLHGFFTVVLPTKDKALFKGIDFPSWLGQNSRYLKHQRIIKEVKRHVSKYVNSGLENFRLYDSYITFLEILNFLKENNVKSAIDLLKEYDLIKDDFVNLSELLLDGQALYKEVKTKTKGDFTRQYNKIKRHLPYEIGEIKKAKGSNNEELEEEDENNFYY